VASRPFRYAIAVTLVFAGVLRALPYPSLRREHGLVLPRNDPYHYRTVVDDLHATADGLALDAVGEQAGEPLFYAVGYWLTLPVGHAPEATAAVFVWVPVAAGVLTAAVVGWIALRATADERVALLSVALLAVYPMHLQYTSVGVVDHHALDYLLLAVSVAAVLEMVQRSERVESPLRDRRLWLSTALFAVAVGAGMLAWNGALVPVLLPVGAYAVAVGVLSLVHERPVSPLLGPLAVGLLGATALAAVPHLRWGWQERAVVVAPALVAAGIALVTAGVWLARRRAWSPARGSAVAAVAPVVTVLGVQAVAPGIRSRFQERLSAWLFTRGHITEAQSLLDPSSLATLKPLTQFGVVLVWGVPGMAWLALRAVRRGDRDTLLLATVAGVLGGLTVLQLRFAGEWAVVLPVVAAVGLFEHLSRMGLCASPLDEGRQRLSAPVPAGVLILLLVLSVGLVVSVQTGGAVAVDDDRAAAAGYLDAHADDESVLSPWGTHRLYNYHASGDGRSYRLSADHYAAVVGGERPPPDSVGWIVVDGSARPDGFDAGWYRGVAERVWQQGDIAVWRVAERPNRRHSHRVSGVYHPGTPPSTPGFLSP
jgi:dolichyl-diphosphooligosaccharide--protein glycosyltransferase